MEKEIAFNQQQKIINEFCLTICTVNGSGSATANNTLYKAFFHMGIPVSGKNIFPSNIKGLPTFYSIRLSQKGYLGRVAHDDIVIAMNADTFSEDLTYLLPGGVIFYADNISLPVQREDVITYPMPIKALLKQADVPRNLRDYMENMLYVGIVGQVLGITKECIKSALISLFGNKPGIVDSNLAVIQLGADWAKENLVKRDRYCVETLDPLVDYILADGNNAGALGSIYGGFQFCGWYPITPATSMVESMIDYAPRLRKEPETGKETYAIVQAEDELAAIGMAVGAGWAGLRSMTSTSGPGLSLMTEYLSLAYYSETPVVVWVVQRVGPSTGLPTRTAQGDLTMTYFMGHGDTNHIILIPGSVNECFEFGWKAFDIAEKYQTPVFVLSDLDLGMNQWMTKRFAYPDRPIDRGKILWEDDLDKWIIEKKVRWGRYLDVDGDGIPYRAVMGNLNPEAAYFTRGTGHDEYGNYTENPVTWKKMLDRLKRKFLPAGEELPEPVIRTKSNASIGIVGMGSTDPALFEAQDLLEEQGIAVDYFRLKALPSGKALADFLENHEKVYIFELNRDGQLYQILQLEHPNHCNKISSHAYVDGLPMTAAWIVSEVLNQESK